MRGIAMAIVLAVLLAASALEASKEGKSFAEKVCCLWFLATCVVIAGGW